MFLASVGSSARSHSVLWLAAAIAWAGVGQARPANVSRSLQRSGARQRQTLPAVEEAPPLGPRTSVAAYAADPAQHPWTVGLSSGFAVPWGAYATTRSTAGFEDSSRSISKDGRGALALAADLGLHLTERVSVGVYALGALLLARAADTEAPLAGGCPEDIQCFGYGLRAGALLRYRFAALHGWRPWAAAALGYEWVFASLQGDALGFPLDLHSGHSGPQWLQIQGGLEHSVGSGLALGPYLDVSAMQYSHCSARAGGAALNCEVSDSAWHGWIMLGVRGTLRL